MKIAKTKRSNWSYLIIVLSLCGCVSTENSTAEEPITEVTVHSSENDLALKDLKAQIIQEGDTLAYNELKEAYFDKPQDLFYYAWFMANGYNYTDAHFDIFLLSLQLDLATNSSPDIFLQRCPDETVEHLIIASDKGHEAAIGYIESFEIDTMRVYTKLKR